MDASSRSKKGNSWLTPRGRVGRGPVALREFSFDDDELPTEVMTRDGDQWEYVEED